MDWHLTQVIFLVVVTATIAESKMIGDAGAASAVPSTFCVLEGWTRLFVCAILIAGRSSTWEQSFYQG